MKESILDSTNIKLFYYVEGKLELFVLLLSDELVELLAIEEFVEVKLFPVDVLFLLVELVALVELTEVEVFAVDVLFFIADEALV